GAMIAGSILLGRALAPVELAIAVWRNFIAARFSYNRLQKTIRDHPAPLKRIRGLGIETADMLTHEVFLRNLRDRRAVPRYAGLTGAPDESGEKRREKGLARAGNARVRRGMIELAWRFLWYQKESALAEWYYTQTANHRKDTKKTMIVALARKLLIALWRMVTTGEITAGVGINTPGMRKKGKVSGP